MNNKLRPCPFCGCEAKLRHVGKGTHKYELGVMVRCESCHCSTEPFYPLGWTSYEARKQSVIKKME